MDQPLDPDEADPAGMSVPTAARQGVHNDQLRLLIDSVKDYAIFLLDRQGHVITWNGGAARIKGYHAGDILGRHFSIFYPREDVERGVPWRALEVAQREGSFEAEGWRVRKDGSRFWANVVITALFAEDGRLYGFGKVTRDVTERRQAEVALASSEERFRLLVESVQDYAIFMLDPAGTVVSWNGGAERIKGYSAAEIVGSHFSRFYTPEDVAAGMPRLVLTRAAAEGRFESEGWRVRKDGSRFWANVIITAVYDPGGSLRGFAKVTRDMTERRRAEETRAELLREQMARATAETNVRLRDEFLAVASHELRTPLTVILGNVELLQRSMTRQNSSGERDLRRVQLVYAQVIRLNRLVQSLLDLSRMAEGQLSLAQEPLDVCALIEELIEEFRPTMAEGYRLDFRPPPGPCLVLGDRLRLQQVFQNIIENAIKYTRRGGTITVTVQPLAEQMQVEVRDTGIGIPAGDLPRIGERFFRAGNAQDAEVTGMGVGLYVVKQLIQLHGGAVDISSQEGGGTQVTVTLPRAVE
ncbi:MAG TPA: PAS domain-containing sensor histidine kinase [Ardenticatenaceae bacterium]|nr:PAS domain-containing sensor histidine kinase [Ardenticatenaceae bacterium]